MYWVLTARSSQVHKLFNLVDMHRIQFSKSVIADTQLPADKPAAYRGRRVVTTAVAGLSTQCINWRKAMSRKNRSLFSSHSNKPDQHTVFNCTDHNTTNPIGFSSLLRFLRLSLEARSKSSKIKAWCQALISIPLPDKCQARLPPLRATRMLAKKQTLCQANSKSRGSTPKATPPHQRRKAVIQLS